MPSLPCDDRDVGLLSLFQGAVLPRGRCGSSLPIRHGGQRYTSHDEAEEMTVRQLLENMNIVALGWVAVFRRHDQAETDGRLSCSVVGRLMCKGISPLEEANGILRSASVCSCFDFQDRLLKDVLAFEIHNSDQHQGGNGKGKRVERAICTFRCETKSVCRLLYSIIS